MTSDSVDRLDAVIASLNERLEEASVQLQQRDEWATARATQDDLVARRDDLLAAPDTLDDVIRQAEAHRDLLDLAGAQVSEEAAVDERVKRERRAEDERLLEAAEKEFKVYAGLILASFALPPFFLAYPPIAKLLLAGLLPAFFGFLRVREVLLSFEGRTWLVFQDRVNQVEDRLKKAHGVAIGAVVMGCLWLVVAFLRVDAQGQ